MIPQARLFPQQLGFFRRSVAASVLVSWTLSIACGLTCLFATESLAQSAKVHPEKQAAPENSASPKPYTVKYGVRFAKTGDKYVRADLYTPNPELAGDGPFPGVLMIHGGGWRAGTKAQMVTHARNVANHGYAVMSINYRLAPKHKFPAQIHDCKAALRWWRERADEYRLDPERVAVYGYSAGGHLACLMGTTDPSHGLEGAGTELALSESPSEVESKTNETSTSVQAVVAGGAPCDFRILPPEATFLGYWLGGTRSEKPKLYERASPQAAVSSGDPPTFFFHGEKDWLVPRHSAEKMHATLLAAGVRSEMYLCPGKGHINAFLDRTAMAKAVEFLDSVLK